MSKLASQAPSNDHRDNDEPIPRLPPQTVALFPILILFFLLTWIGYLRLGESPITGSFFTYQFPSGPDHARIDSPEPLTIEVREDTIFVPRLFGKSLPHSDLSVLRRHLSTNRHAINWLGGLIVRPEPDARMQQIIDVMRVIKESGITYYGLQ